MAEHCDIVPANQNLYCLDPFGGSAGTGAMLKVSSSYFTNFLGSLLITQSGDGYPYYAAKLIVVYWDGTNFISRKILYSIYSKQFEAVTFAPSPF